MLSCGVQLICAAQEIVRPSLGLLESSFPRAYASLECECIQACPSVVLQLVAE